MDTDAKGQLGGLECGKEQRERMAKEGNTWKCSVCGKNNGEILKEREGMCEEAGGEEKRKEEEIPEELRLAYREDLGKKSEQAEDHSDLKTSKGDKARAKAQNQVSAATTSSASATNAASRPVSAPVLRPTRTVSAAPVQLVQQSPDRSLAWIDTCIYGVVAALLFMVLRKFV